MEPDMNMLSLYVHNRDLNAISPSLRRKEPTPIKEWQDTARAKLYELTGFDKIRKADDDLFKIESETEYETYTDYRIVFQSENDYFVPCHLWVPKSDAKKIPLVICLQGHSKGAHISLGRPKFPGDDRNFAVQIVNEGYCALAIEQRGFGECGGTEKGPACISHAMSAILYGRTIIAERVFDISRAIDVVTKNFDVVDADKIACMGNSGGGTATIYAAAMDERIKVAMPSCALCTYKDSIGAMMHCSCNYIPNIANYFDMGDLCGLVAPRGLVVVSGLTDRIFPHDGVAASVELAREYFRAADAEDRLAWIEGPEGHRFYAALSWPTFHKFFD